MKQLPLLPPGPRARSDEGPRWLSMSGDPVRCVGGGVLRMAPVPSIAQLRVSTAAIIAGGRPAAEALGPYFPLHVPEETARAGTSKRVPGALSVATDRTSLRFSSSNMDARESGWGTETTPPASAGPGVLGTFGNPANQSKGPRRGALGQASAACPPQLPH